MERRGLAVIVCCVLVLTACGVEAPTADLEPVEAVEDTVSESQPEAVEQVADQVTKEASAVTEEVEVSQADTAEEVSNPESSEPTLSDLEVYLSDKGVLSGDPVRKAGEMVGALDGVGYDGCEIYMYDTSSEAYQKVVNGEEIFIEGLESLGGITFDAINGPFTLILKGSDSGLIEAFNSFK